MFILSYLFFALTTSAHPFYLSVLEVHHNTSENTLECALKIFTDDLENAISDHSGKPLLNLGTSIEPDDADERIWDYIIAHINMQNHQLHYVGREGDLDAQWIYFEIPLTNQATATLSWSSLIHVLPSQKNILQLHTQNSQQTFIFDRRKTKHTLQFQP